MLHRNCLACASIVASGIVMDAMKVMMSNIDVKQRKQMCMLLVAFIMQCVPISIQLFRAFSTVAQIFFDTAPFDGNSDLQIMRLVTNGGRPDRLQSPQMENETWDLIQSCWNAKPSERPTMRQIVRTLTLLQDRDTRLWWWYIHTWFTYYCCGTNMHVISNMCYTLIS